MRNARFSKSTIVACVVAAVIVSTAFMASYRFVGSWGERDNEVPSRVSQFFETYLDRGRDRSTDYDLVDEYFDTSATPDTWGDYEQYTLARMFYERVDDFASYSIEAVTPGFLKIQLFRDDGSRITPPIGFLYRMSDDGQRIKEWSIAHLQPFSKYDPEFGEVQ